MTEATFSEILAFNGEYLFPWIKPGTRVALTIAGVFDSATATLGYSVPQTGHGGRVLQLSGITTPNLGTVLLPETAAGVWSHPSGYPSVTSSAGFHEILCDDSLTVFFTSTDSVTTPDRVRAWTPNGSPAGTPVLAFVDDNSFSAYVDSAGSAYAFTAAGSIEAVVPASGRLAVRVASVAAAAALRLAVVPVA